MPKLLYRFTPAPLRKPAERFYKKVCRFGISRFCPICRSWVRAFKPFGLANRPDACCPVCSSLERHRFLWIFLKKQTNLFDGSHKTMLHIAPEKELVTKFSQVKGVDYLTADLNDPTAMVKVDITNIQYPDNSYDVIYCSHVLEHVSDDYKAIQEFFRVLKTDGWAIFMVPITAATTFENPSITNPSERERVFGQHNHVRIYGPDFKERLEDCGFAVKSFHTQNLLNEKQTIRLGLNRLHQKKMPIYYCTKLS